MDRDEALFPEIAKRAKGRHAWPSAPSIRPLCVSARKAITPSRSNIFTVPVLWSRLTNWVGTNRDEVPRHPDPRCNSVECPGFHVGFAVPHGQPR